MPKLTTRWRDFRFDAQRQRPLLVATALLMAATPWLAGLNEREEIAPARQHFAQFPLLTERWIGREGALERDVLDTLKLSDYLMADYVRTGNSTAPSINLYVAWYQSQKKGASIHSPRSCIPGGGWRMDDLAPHTVDVQHVSGQPLRVNRAVIRKDSSAQLVYYWFEGRGRDVTNEFLAKWYIFTDSLLHARSDGALVRVITAIPDGGDIADGDRQLEAFLRDFYPQLTRYVP